MAAQCAMGSISLPMAKSASPSMPTASFIKGQTLKKAISLKAAPRRQSVAIRAVMTPPVSEDEISRALHMLDAGGSIEVAAAVYRVEQEKFGESLSDNLADLAARDADGRVTFYVLLWKRSGLSLELFDDYWRNVHGPVCARLPGQHQYWQFHVAHSDGGIWQAPAGVEIETAEHRQFDGIAELTFRSVEQRAIWFKAAGILMDDEHNGNSITFKDVVRNPAPNGTQPFIKLHTLIRKARVPSADTQAFRRYMMDFTGALYSIPQVTKIRLHLFDGLDLSRPDAQGVAHGETEQYWYQAALELCFPTKLDMELFFEHPKYKAACADQARYVAAMGVFPQRTAYTFVYSDKMTMAGIRSSVVAQNITDIGATNQLRDDISELMVKGWGQHML
eukprot:jgi/Chlat1/382/Chrsp10S01490